jgi:hypothetical protein
LNPIPPNLTGVDTIATQLDSQDIHYGSQVADTGIRPLNPVYTQLDSQFLSNG